jgi:CubicO group peptidase (beta-lactamase class C family)
MRCSVLLTVLALAGTMASAATAFEPAGPNLDSLIQAEMATHQIPGLAACVVRGSELAWHGEYGFARLEDSVPVVDSTVFDLASVSKTATAAALMQLCERGAFGLDDDINASLPFSVRHPAYPSTSVTFRMLLTHTSGIADYWPTFQALERQGDPDVSLRRFVEGYLVPGGEFYDSANNFCPWPPGGQYQYCNLAIALAGYLVEALSDSFHLYTRDSLFLPLEMDRTVWYFRDIDTNSMAMPYYFAGGRHYRYGHQSWPDVPAGTMKSSAPQLGRFLSMMLGWGELNGTRALDSATVAQMTTVQHPAGIGLVWFHEYIGQHEVWSHGGLWNGISTWIGFCRADNSGVVVLCNIEAVHGSILGVIAPALFDWGAGGIEDDSKPKVASLRPTARIVRDVLLLPETSSRQPQAASWLTDATGRRVAALRPGANDVGSLSPGVYFITQQGSGAGDVERPNVSKVVLTR